MIGGLARLKAMLTGVMGGLGRVCLWVSDSTAIFSSVFVQVDAIISHGQRCFLRFAIFLYVSFISLA